MIRIFEHILGFTRITVTESERVLVLRNGRFEAVLGAGEHRVSRHNTVLERFIVDRTQFPVPRHDALRRERPDLTDRHLVRFEAAAGEVLVVFRDGRVTTVLAPEMRIAYWADAGPWTSQAINVQGDLAVPADLAKRVERVASTFMHRVDVPEGHVGLMTIDGAEAQTLHPGAHYFWNVGRKVAAKLVDTRWRTLDVTGQDILTRDRVTLRVNIAAVYRVTDPELANRAVKDFAEALHRALQLAFRKTLGGQTLDALLEDKTSVDVEAAEVVRTEMAAIGVEVGEIALKDVILPGEMREILNKVVAVQKEAEANVIRRREETNATRSLLNTAKVMAENPVMLRLKELEALESIASKVDHLTVHNGTEGLMSDIVRLRDKA